MKGIAMILDSSIMLSLIEGKTLNSKRILKKLSDLKVRNERAKILTTLSSFQNSIWRADSKSEIKNLKKLLDLVDIFPDKPTDFTDNKAVVKTLIEFAKDLTDMARKLQEARKNERS